MKERILRALRSCENPPDFFLYIGDSEYMLNISGIPVYVVRNIFYNAKGDSGLEYIPVWKDEHKNEQSKFERAFDN